MVRLLDPGIGHVEVMVFKHQCPLWPDEVLKPCAALREKLSMAGNFRRVFINCRVNGSGPRVEVGNHPADRRESETHHQGSSDEASSRMRGAAQHLLADQLKALQWKP